MITNNADLDSAELGWGWKSITSAVKKAVVQPTKFVVQKTIVDPTKIVAKSTGRMVTGTASAAGKLVRGDVTGAGKSFVKASLEPVRGGAQLTKQAGQTAYAASKAITNLALAPLRSRLNTLKDRRAKLLSYQKRRSKVPTVAEKAQARKDVKSMLSSKGPHGKMLSWLAGPPGYDGFGVVGYDDAAIAAVATALTASLVKIINDAAKSKFAPADAAKEGVKAGASQALTTAAASIKPSPEEPATPAEPVTQEEVAEEPAAEAEEAATKAETEEIEGALAGAGLLAGFMEAAPAAAVPEAMDLSTARKLAGAAQRAICRMPASSIVAIGGQGALNVAGSFCRAYNESDEAMVRATLPTVVVIAARSAADIATQAVNSQPAVGLGCSSCFGAARKRGKKGKRYVFPFEDCMRYYGGSEEARRRCQSALNGLSGDDVGMLAAFAGADLEGLSFGLAGVGLDDIAATAPSSALALIPAAAAVLAGLWMATH